MVKGAEIQKQSEHKVASIKLVHRKHSFAAQGLS